MNRNGFSVNELIITMAIAVVAIGGVVTASQKGINASVASTMRAKRTSNIQNPMETVVREIQRTFPGGAHVYNHEQCTAQSAKDMPFYGHPEVCDFVDGSYMIQLKAPIIDNTPIANTRFTPDGKIKYGAYDDNGVGYQHCYYQYKVNKVNDQYRLVRTTFCPDPAECGDGNCDAATEDCTTCPSDCGSCCGQDGWDDTLGQAGQDGDDCDIGLGENCFVCKKDCGSCCPDGYCDVAFEENCLSCPADCGFCDNFILAGSEDFGCGDGKCASFEDCANCPADCGECAVCGNYICEDTESCGSCPQDCGDCELPS